MQLTTKSDHVLDFPIKRKSFPLSKQVFSFSSSIGCSGGNLYQLTEVTLSVHIANIHELLCSNSGRALAMIMVLGDYSP